MENIKSILIDQNQIYLSKLRLIAGEEAIERYQQWAHDDSGCDLISFMDGININENLLTSTCEKLQSIDYAFFELAQVEKLAALRDALKTIAQHLT